jgi:rod shape-determining protein MreD
VTQLASFSFYKKFLSLVPVGLLFFSVLNEFDFNYPGIENFSFNFTYILIFYWSLKKSNSLGYGLIFVAGLFNDVVAGMPIGVSSLMYLLICGFASFLRNITLRPNLVKDWIFFLITILAVNSLSYILLSLFFSFEINYYDLLINIVFTFLFYLLFAYLFGIFEKVAFGKSND